MNKKQFYSNLKQFEKILLDNSTSLQSFLFHSKGYVEGIRRSISETEKYCKLEANILDLGCGTGFSSMCLSSLGFYVYGIDTKVNNPEMIEELKKRRGLQDKIWRTLKSNNLKFCFYNGIKLPFDNKSFDAVVAHAVIEHIPINNVDLLLREIRRIFKKNGYFFIFRTPREQSYAECIARILHLGSHKVLIDERKLLFKLKKNGFKIVSIKRTDLFFWNLPGKFQYLWNFLSPTLLIIDQILLKTALNYFAHNIQIVCRRSD